MNNNENNINNNIEPQPMNNTQPQPMNNTQPQSMNNVQPTYNNTTGTSSNGFMCFLKNKKIIVGIIALVIVVVIGIVVYSVYPKTLTCTNKQTLSGIETKTTLKLKFAGQNLKRFDAELYADLGVYASFKDALIKEFDEEFKEIKEGGGKLCYTTTDDTLTYTVSASRSGLSAMADNVKSSRYKELKKELESQGFECK